MKITNEGRIGFLNLFFPKMLKIFLICQQGKRSSKDKIIWHLDKKSIFMVKSAYHLVMESNSHHETSQSDRTKAFHEWKCLWKTWVLPRIKVCTWKITNDIIQSKADILKKGIDLNPLCFFFSEKCGIYPSPNVKMQDF